MNIRQSVNGLLAVGAVLSASTILSGCSGGNSGPTIPTPPTTVPLGSASAAETAAFVADFNKANPAILNDVNAVAAQISNKFRNAEVQLVVNGQTGDISLRLFGSSKTYFGGEASYGNNFVFRIETFANAIGIRNSDLGYVDNKTNTFPLASKNALNLLVSKRDTTLPSDAETLVKINESVSFPDGRLAAILKGNNKIESAEFDVVSNSLKRVGVFQLSKFVEEALPEMAGKYNTIKETPRATNQTGYDEIVFVLGDKGFSFREVVKKDSVRVDAGGSGSSQTRVPNQAFAKAVLDGFGSNPRIYPAYAPA